jgi:hypothetical protein
MYLGNGVSDFRLSHTSFSVAFRLLRVNGEKTILDASILVRPVCLSIRMFQRSFHWTNLMLRTSRKMCLEAPNLVKIGQKYRSLYMKT